MSPAHFEYRPIDQSAAQIRVLTLRPGSSDDPISCTLTHHRLQHETNYEAISYCWGNPNRDHLIYIGTISLRVTKSAHDALRHLRLKDRSRRIWIDAICINQADRNERNHQVQLMAQIYKGASRVLAWLGPASSGSDKAMKLVKSVSAKSVAKPAIEVWHAVQALGDLMKRPFWSRTWILQEMICPEKPPLIGCGTQWVDWDTWASASPLSLGSELEDILNPKASILGGQTVEAYSEALEVFSGINYQRGLTSGLHQHQGITDLIRLLTLSMNSKCSDIRDHVFAILGMMHNDSTIPADIQPPKPDYNKRVRRVYTEMAKFAIESDKTLLILSLRTHRWAKVTLPSWTPDFSYNDFDLQYPPLSRITRSVPSQSQHLPQVVEDGETLRVHGKKIGTIQETQSVFSFRDGARHGLVDDITEFADIEELYLCLTGAQEPDGLPWFREAAYNGFRLLDDLNPDPDFQAGLSRVMETINRTVALKGDVSYPHRPLYKVIGGIFHVGLGSPGCVAGDIVCLIAGGHAPMILRPIPLHRGRYQYIGDSYVPGLMEEDMERALADDIGVEWARFDMR